MSLDWLRGLLIGYSMGLTEFDPVRLLGPQYVDRVALGMALTLADILESDPDYPDADWGHQLDVGQWLRQQVHKELLGCGQ